MMQATWYLNLSAWRTLTKRFFFVQKDYLKTSFESLGELLVTFPSILLYSLFVAIILNQKFKGRTIARAIFFLPVIIASVWRQSVSQTL